MVEELAGGVLTLVLGNAGEAIDQFLSYVLIYPYLAVIVGFAADAYRDLVERPEASRRRRAGRSLSYADAALAAFAAIPIVATSLGEKSRRPSR